MRVLTDRVLKRDTLMINVVKSRTKIRVTSDYPHPTIRLTKNIACMSVGITYLSVFRSPPGLTDFRLRGC